MTDPRSRHDEAGLSSGGAATPPPVDEDPVLIALAEVEAAAHRMRTTTDLVLARAAQLCAWRARGHSWRQIVATEERPLIVELLTQANRDFELHGSRFRQAEGAALRQEGLRQEGLRLEEIGALFGVTRQRIPALLGRPAPQPGARAPCAPPVRSGMSPW